jgi:Ca2+-transporting ATPase
MVITVLFGIIIGALTLAAYLYVPISILIGTGEHISIANIDALLDPAVHAETYAKAQTFAFTTLGISQLFNALGFRKLHKSFFSVNHLQNKMMIVAFIIGFGLQIAVTEVPFFVTVFETTRLSLQEWLSLTAVCTIPLWVHEIYRPINNLLLKKRTEKGKTRKGVLHG